jgi:hypothetical protein
MGRQGQLAFLSRVGDVFGESVRVVGVDVVFYPVNDITVGRGLVEQEQQVTQVALIADSRRPRLTGLLIAALQFGEPLSGLCKARRQLRVGSATNTTELSLLNEFATAASAFHSLSSLLFRVECPCILLLL